VTVVVGPFSLTTALEVMLFRCSPGTHSTSAMVKALQRNVFQSFLTNRWPFLLAYRMVNSRVEYHVALLNA
jgi:hypothetical protein